MITKQEIVCYIRHNGEKPIGDAYLLIDTSFCKQFHALKRTHGLNKLGSTVLQMTLIGILHLVVWVFAVRSRSIRKKIV